MRGVDEDGACIDPIEDGVERISSLRSEEGVMRLVRDRLGGISEI